MLHTVVIVRCLGLPDTEQQREGIYSEALVALPSTCRIQMWRRDCTWPFYGRDGLEHLQILVFGGCPGTNPLQIPRDDCL